MNKTLHFFVIIALSLSTAATLKAQTLPMPDHIVILIEENYAYSQIYGSSLAPHITALANDTAHAALFTQFYAIEHPSQPNYLDFFAGSNQGVLDDNVPAGYPFTTDNLGAQLIAASKTFVTYNEDMPSVGYDGATYGSYGYVRKHNPCTNWIGTGVNQLPASVNQPFTAFPGLGSYASLPTVCYVIPNEVNDMHEYSIAAGDTWEYNKLDSFRKWALNNNTLYIITFDEDDDFHSNNILTIFYGPMVKGGTYSNHQTLYDLLRTIEAMYGLPYAGNAATGTTINYCWKPRAAVQDILKEDMNFSVSPNPANDIVTFQSNMHLTEPVQLIISDMVGRIMEQHEITNDVFTVNSRDLKEGVYIFNISNGSNIHQTGKFTVAH